MLIIDNMSHIYIYIYIFVLLIDLVVAGLRVWGYYSSSFVLIKCYLNGEVTALPKRGKKKKKIWVRSRVEAETLFLYYRYDKLKKRIFKVIDKKDRK